MSHNLGNTTLRQARYTTDSLSDPTTTTIQTTQTPLDSNTVEDVSVGEDRQIGIIVYIYATVAVIFVLGVCLIFYTNRSTLFKMAAYVCCFRCCPLKCLSRENKPKQNEVSTRKCKKRESMNDESRTQ